MMSTTFAMNTVTATTFGHKVDIPSAPIAKLMYYLDCVNAVVQIDDISNSKLIDYQNYFKLSSAEQKLVYEIAKLLDPSKFINAGVFIHTPQLIFSDNTDNEFIELKQETIGAHFNQEIMIAGKSVKLKKTMACNDRWLNCFYFKPMYEYINPNRIITSSPEFGAEPVSMTCPYCGSSITTKTEEKFQIIACICCLLNWLIYCCVQICRNKNLCCFNVTHRCPKCGRVVGKYNAC